MTEARLVYFEMSANFHFYIIKITGGSKSVGVFLEIYY